MMKKILSILLIISNSYAHSELVDAFPILEKTFSTLKDLRKDSATGDLRNPYKGYHPNALGRYVQNTESILTGACTTISQDKFATADERINVLGGMFQNEIVNHNLGKEFQDIDVSKAKNQAEKNHLAALWIMKKGVNIIFNNVYLGGSDEGITNKLLNMKNGFLGLNLEIQNLFTKENLSIIFPKGFFQRFIGYAYNVKDYQNQGPLIGAKTVYGMDIGSQDGSLLLTPRSKKVLNSRFVGNELHVDEIDGAVHSFRRFAFEDLDSIEKYKVALEEAKTKLSESLRENFRLKEEVKNFHVYKSGADCSMAQLSAKQAALLGQMLGMVAENERFKRAELQRNKMEEENKKLSSQILSFQAEKKTSEKTIARLESENKGLAEDKTTKEDLISQLMQQLLEQKSQAEKDKESLEQQLHELMQEHSGVQSQSSKTADQTVVFAKKKSQEMIATPNGPQLVTRQLFIGAGLGALVGAGVMFIYSNPDNLLQILSLIKNPSSS